MTRADQGKLSFGDKLAYLVETVHPPDRGLYSYREIAAGIAEHPRTMTAAHINQLVRGFTGEAAVLDADEPLAVCSVLPYCRLARVPDEAAQRPRRGFPLQWPLHRLIPYPLVRHLSLSCIHPFTERDADVSRAPTLCCRSYAIEGNEGNQR